MWSIKTSKYKACGDEETFFIEKMENEYILYITC